MKHLQSLERKLMTAKVVIGWERQDLAFVRHKLCLEDSTLCYQISTRRVIYQCRVLTVHFPRIGRQVRFRIPQVPQVQQWFSWATADPRARSLPARCDVRWVTHLRPLVLCTDVDNKIATYSCLVAQSHFGFRCSGIKDGQLRRVTHFAH
jgi:hypothetical protein